MGLRSDGRGSVKRLALWVQGKTPEFSSLFRGALELCWAERSPEDAGVYRGLLTPESFISQDLQKPPMRALTLRLSRESLRIFSITPCSESSAWTSTHFHLTSPPARVTISPLPRNALNQDMMGVFWALFWHKILQWESWTLQWDFDETPARI